MRVLHICYSDSRGGAAIGAYRLHHAMRYRDVESEFLAMHKGTYDTSVIRFITPDNVEEYKSSIQLNHNLRELYELENLPIRNFNLSGPNVSEFINEHPADIVQLHWIGNNTLPLRDLPLIERPIVWKMPDMWPFSGGEHYIRHGDPERYKAGYDVTPPYIDAAIDVDRMVWEVKRKYYQDLPLTIVSPSHFLAKCAHESALFKDYDCHVISNPLASEYTHGSIADAAEQKQIRATLGLPLEKMIVLFGAFSTNEARKGFHHIKNMLANHLQNLISPQEVSFLVCGANESSIEKLNGYDLFSFPTTDEPSEFKRYLRAADLLLFPSEMDSTAMVVQEALAQGVPSIVFDVGGLPEMVIHEQNGYLAKPYKAEELAAGMAWWKRCENKNDIKQFASQRSRKMHNPARTVDAYLTLYDKVLDRYKHKKSFKTGAFYDAAPLADKKPLKQRVFIVDPSAITLKDSSHHAEHVLAFASQFAAGHILPTLVINKEANFNNPVGHTKPLLGYAIYDKIRARKDARGASTDDAERILERDQSSELSFSIYHTLKQIDEEYQLTRDDAIFFPTTDRFCVEGALFYLYGNQKHGSPTFHFNLMFEKAEFLLGRYPLDRLMEAVKGSTYLDKKLFLYAETQQMADDLSIQYDVPVEPLTPPQLFTKAQLSKLQQNGGPNTRISDFAIRMYHKIEQLRESIKTGDVFQKPEGKHLVASLGRGRRDKGWAKLPEIIKTYNEAYPNSDTVFVVQKPRSMDGLYDEERAMEKLPNVIMLDEIISDELLDSVCEQTDIFLLPYDRGVYHNRGSAFCGRAVALGKPMIVSAGTALAEALVPKDKLKLNGNTSIQNGTNPSSKAVISGTYANGFVATTPKEISDSIQRILQNLSAYDAAAGDIMTASYSACVHDNPIKKKLAEDHFHAARKILVIQEGDNPLAIPETANDSYVAIINVSNGEPTVSQPVLGEPDGAPLNFSLELKDGVLRPDSLPAFIKDALDHGRIAAIYTSKDLAIAEGLLRGWPAEWRNLVELL